jgi:AraC family transcriptional activator of pobA
MNDAIRAHARPDSDPETLRLRRARISAPGIMDPAADDPRLARPEVVLQGTAGHAPASVLAPVIPAMPDAAPASALPRSRPGDGLRLTPLAAFHCGETLRGRKTLASPRVRGDHVLMRPVAGVVSIEFPRQTHVLVAGRIAFIPAGTAFSLEPAPDTEGEALLIPPAWAGTQPLPKTFCSGWPAAGDAILLVAAIRALSEGVSRAPGGDSATPHQLGLIAAVLTRLEERAGRTDMPLDSLAGAQPLTGRFLELARSEITAGRTIAEMARALGCSLAQIDRACRQSRGRSALELIYDLRLQLAAEALRDSARPVGEIAEELGYAGLGHFMRAFQAATGRTPDGYRALMRDNPGQGMD